VEPVVSDRYPQGVAVEHADRVMVFTPAIAPGSSRFGVKEVSASTLIGPGLVRNLIGLESLERWSE